MSIAHYLLQVNIYLVVFYGFYKLLLDKETYFTLNRIYLISAGLLSLVIPYLRFEWFTKQEAIQPVYVSMGQLMGQVSMVEEKPGGFNPGQLIVLIYLIGVLFFSMRLILQLLLLSKKLKQNRKGSAFSFFWKKRIDAGLPQLETIHKHEDIHVSQWHSLDILFFELLSVFTWFNPIVYLYKHDIRSIHEYVADEAAAKFQGDKASYAMLLLSNAFNVPVSTLTNSFFNKSLIKKRIFMLHKKRSPKIAILKYGLFIPLFATALVLSSATIRDNEKVREIADYIPLDEPVSAVAEIAGTTISFHNGAVSGTKSVNTTVVGQQDPKWQPFYSYMKSNLMYPVDAKRKQLQGSTMIKFSIADGLIENVGVVAKLGEGCDVQAMQKILAYTGFRNVKNGNYTLKVTFLIDGAKTEKKNKDIIPLKGYTALNELTITTPLSTNINDVIVTGYNKGTSDESKVFDFASLDRQPLFPGGMYKFYDYLAKSIRYPKEAHEKKIEGKVFLSFVVEKDGKLSDVTVRRSLGSGTDEEAVRVLSASPNWLPGEVNGNPVRVLYNIPVSFNLNKSDRILDNQQDKTGAVPSSESKGMQFDSNGSSVKFGENSLNPPLVVIDGKISSNAEMQTIKPENIESISVLKDASATAIYGVKGANGVIIITTKSAKSMEKGKETKE